MPNINLGHKCWETWCKQQTYAMGYGVFKVNSLRSSLDRSRLQRTVDTSTPSYYQQAFTEMTGASNCRIFSIKRHTLSSRSCPPSRIRRIITELPHTCDISGNGLFSWVEVLQIVFACHTHVPNYTHPLTHLGRSFHYTISLSGVDYTVWTTLTLK